jgi:hypothetical protein
MVSLLTGGGDIDMTLTDWDRLDAAADRIARLTQESATAAAEGDKLRARYFARKAQDAAADRQLILDRISTKV